MRIKKSEIKDIDDEGILIEYKGRDWKIPYGKYTNMDQVVGADDDDFIYINKYGNRWLISRVGGKSEGEYKKQNGTDKFAQLEDRIKKLEQRIEYLENMVKKEW